MKGKKVSTYAAALIIVLCGVGAVMLIMDASTASKEAANKKPIDPFDINTNFTTKKQQQEALKNGPQ